MRDPAVEIFGILSSPTRLKILKTLEAKELMSYTELKNSVGLDSQRESGKFAYHLRKLSSRRIVELDREKKKYRLTQFGRFILDVEKGIRRATVAQHEKKRVITSKCVAEAFNPDEIYMFLVREVGLPREKALQISSEVERCVDDLKKTTLETFLINDIIKCTLLNHDLEEYAAKLRNYGPMGDEIEHYLRDSYGTKYALPKLKQEVFADALSRYVFSLFNGAVRDLVIAGELSISRLHTWLLCPETLFLDLRDFSDKCRGGTLPLARGLGAGGLTEGPLTPLFLLLQRLSPHASEELVVRDFLELVQEEAGANLRELPKRFAEFLLLFSATLASLRATRRVSLSLNLDGSGDRDSAAEALLEGHMKCAGEDLNEFVVYVVNHGARGIEKHLLQKIAELMGRGVGIMFNTTPYGVSFEGLRGPRNQRAGALFHSLSLNLGFLSQKYPDEVFLKNVVKERLQLINGLLMGRLEKVLSSMEGDVYLHPLLGDQPRDRVAACVNLFGLDFAASKITAGDAAVSDAWVNLASFISRIEREHSRNGIDVRASIHEDEECMKRVLFLNEKYGRRGDRTICSSVPVVSLSQLLEESKIRRELSRRAEALEGGYHVLIRLEKGVELTADLLYSLLDLDVPFKILKS